MWKLGPLIPVGIWIFKKTGESVVRKFSVGKWRIVIQHFNMKVTPLSLYFILPCKYAAICIRTNMKQIPELNFVPNTFRINNLIPKHFSFT